MRNNGNRHPYSSNNCGELIINADNIEILGTIDADSAGFDGGQGGLSQSSSINTTLTSCANKDNCYTVQVLGAMLEFKWFRRRLCQIMELANRLTKMWKLR